MFSLWLFFLFPFSLWFLLGLRMAAPLRPPFFFFSFTSGNEQVAVAVGLFFPSPLFSLLFPLRLLIIARSDEALAAHSVSVDRRGRVLGVSFSFFFPSFPLPFFSFPRCRDQKKSTDETTPTSQASFFFERHRRAR